MCTSFALHAMHAFVWSFLHNLNKHYESNSFTFTDIFQKKISPIHTWVWMYKCIELIAIRQCQPHLRGKGKGDSSTRTKFYYYSSWLPLISPGVYQLAQILINSIKYLQTCLSIHYRLVSLQPRAIPEFVYKCQVHVHVLSISQRGITLTERKNYQQSNMNHLIAQRILKQLSPCYYMNSNNIFIMARYIYSVHKVWDRLGICNFEPPWSLCRNYDLPVFL